jgi:arginase family enzyme
MLNKPLRVLNFDDSVIKQRNLICRYNPQIIDLKEIAPQARFWMTPKIREEIKKQILPSPETTITLIGSGDFHHLSQLLISQFTMPLSVIVFDFHPDWDKLPPKLGCGSWVTESLQNPNILKFILAGVSSTDISSGYLESANLGSLRDNRVEIYPYLHDPSMVFLRRIPQNISLKVRSFILFKMVYWSQLKGRDLLGFFASLIERLPVRQAYISIDKDCLRKEYALTNWEEGLMSLDELLTVLKLIKEKLEIVGVDIVGDYSPVRVKGRLKAMLSRLDHPRNIEAQKHPEHYISAINEKTNLQIIDTLNS